MSYVIEDNVPLPKSRGNDKGTPGPRTALTRLLGAMEPGQSVLTQDPKDYKAAQQFAVREKPRKFAFRKLREGWRIWRTE